MFRTILKRSKQPFQISQMVLAARAGNSQSNEGYGQYRQLLWIASAGLAGALLVHKAQGYDLLTILRPKYSHAEENLEIT